MSFQVGIGSLGGTLFFQVGLCTPLQTMRWFRRLCYFYKFKSYRLPPYLFQLIPQESHSYNAGNSEDIPTYHCRTDSFFLWTIHVWNKLNLDIVNQLTVYLGSIYLRLFNHNLLQLLMFVILLNCTY